MDVSGQLHAPVVHLWGKSPQYLLDRMHSRTHTWSGRGVEKIPVGD